MRFLFIEKNKRLFGLDIIRAAAILLVLYSHRNLISSTDSIHHHFNYLCGFFGVELFFVLSGFLIGIQLINLGEKKSTKKEYFLFIKKRWLRTLPLYFIILGLYAYFAFEKFPWENILFLQNTLQLNKSDASIFNQSWSLTVEEYAYVLIPILFYLVTRFKKWSIQFKLLIVLLGIIIFSVLARYYYASNIYQINYDDWIRKSTFLRIDSIAVGILMAWLKYYYINIFKWLSNPIIPAISLIIILTLNYYGNILVSKDTDYLIFPSTVGLTFINTLLVLFIPFFNLHPVNEFLSKWKLIYFSVSITAILSYCIYLIHIPFYEYFYIHLDGKIPFKLNVFLMLITVYSISIISYLAIERPIQNLFKGRIREIKKADE
jgi:peptidoglycan/LPS O-acetylase OafA/YrhL